MSARWRAAAFWIDHEYDRDFGSAGPSRYAAYVRQNRSAFTEVFEFSEDTEVGSVNLAAMAWRVATSPVMSPGYVRYHPRVLRCQLGRSHWDGKLAAEIELVAGWPVALAHCRDWRSGRRWVGWPEESGVYYEPSIDDQDLAHRSYLACTARAVFRVGASRLPKPDLDHLDSYAAEAVGALVGALNPIISPIVAQLEGQR